MECEFIKYQLADPIRIFRTDASCMQWRWVAGEKETAVGKGGEKVKGGGRRRVEMLQGQGSR